MERSGNEDTTAALQRLKAVDLVSPIEQINRKLQYIDSVPSGPLLNSLVLECLTDIKRLQSAIPVLREDISRIPGIQHSVNRQTKRLENLNFAVSERANLLQRYHTILGSENFADSMNDSA